MDRSGLEERIAALERENRIIKKKLERSNENRVLLEEALESHVKALKILNAEIEESRDNVLSSIGDAVFSLDNEWRLTYMNVAAFRYGYMADHLGKEIWEIIPSKQPFYDEYHHAKQENTPVYFETFAPQTTVLVEVSAYPTSKGLLVIYHDITGKKLLEDQVSRLDRLRLIGEMAAGIAHEIRNPMTTVRGYLQLFLKKAGYEKLNSQVSLMISELDRANSIISEYLSLARDKHVSMSEQSLNAIIDPLLPLLEADALLSGKYVVAELSCGLPDVFLDTQEIRQMILNLSKNGLEAMSSGGRLTIGTFAEDEQVVLFIRDQGSGIPHEIQEKIGTPFFTTKENGTGLGLAICYSIALRHQAVIDVNTGDDGTTFIVKFGCKK